MKKTVVFYTSYPRKGQIHDKKIVGGASYTKTLLTHLKKNNLKLDIVVYAENFDKKPQTYTEQGITVKRIWKRNNIMSLIGSITSLLKEKTNDLYISYEVNMVGGPLLNICFLLLLSLVKADGKKITFIPHQVVSNFADLEGKSIKTVLLNGMKNMLFQYISYISTILIVFEEYLKHALPNARKAHTIPLAVEDLKSMNKMQARKKLNINRDEFVILFFGFISPYKGIEDLLKGYNNKAGLLILAGDGNPNHMSKKWYQEYVSNIKNEAQKKGALTPGFIEEEEIQTYYAAADVVVLPYRIFFSSSFPLSLAFSYEKPVLFSKALKNYFKSTDLQKALNETRLKQEDVVINFASDLQKAVTKIKTYKEEYVSFSQKVKELRSWKRISQQFSETIYS